MLEDYEVIVVPKLMDASRRQAWKELWRWLLDSLETRDVDTATPPSRKSAEKWLGGRESEVVDV